jgi:hypothetical protein
VGAEVWISESLQLVCFKAEGGTIEGRPVHALLRIEEVRGAWLAARLRGLR